MFDCFRSMLCTSLTLCLLILASCGGCGDKTVKPGETCSDDAECGGGFCVSGVCATCRGHDEGCASAQVCQDGSCVEDCAEATRCQNGGDCCPGRDECRNGSCEPLCAGPRCGESGEICCAADEVCEDQRCLPDCGSGSRCGASLEMCCPAGQLCYGFRCTEQGQACQRQSDCPDGQACEVDLGICIDRAAIGDCEYHPPAGVFDPIIECRWTPPAGQVTPERNDIVMAPVVANLTDDNGDGLTDVFDTPDLVFTSYDLEGDACCNVDGTLRIVSGACQSDGAMLTHASLADPGIDNSGGIAIGDLDGDGVPEIVAMLNNSRQPQGTIAFRRVADDGSQWAEYWRNNDIPTWNVHTRGAAQPALADLDGDGLPEVVVGNAVLNGQDGSLRWDGVVTSGGRGGIGNNAFLGPVSTVADIDLDGELEVLAGNTCYSADGTVKWSYTYTTQNSPCGGRLACDGYTATANFDDDDEGEVVIVRQGEVFVLQHNGDLLFSTAIPVDDCPNNESGPPTVADFDGDGHAEIGTAAGDYYVVVDLDCVGTPLPAGCASEGVLWNIPNQDCSSRVTASSVFDFDGDGSAEVVYADETSFRILDGRTGAELYVDETHGSHTRLEMPVIADVDNDGNAEVVIAENAAVGGTPGVEIWGDAADNWVFTRRIWNQHSYHVTNIAERGGVPQSELPNWLQPGLNNFRQNTQGEGLFWAPDLVIVNLAVLCLADLSLHIVFDVMNQGSRMVGAGLAVSLYIDGQVMVTLQSQGALLPGQTERMSWDWVVPEGRYNVPLEIRVVADDDGSGQGAHNECDDGGEDNNVASQTSVLCGPQN